MPLNRTHRLLIVLGMIVLAAAGDLVWHYPGLPARMATKFNFAGEATEWSSKGGFLAVQIVMSLVLVAFALAGRYSLPLLPSRLINIPHREYWLAPERRDGTLRKVGELVLTICVANFALVTALTHLTLRANLAPTPTLGREPLWLVGALLLTLVVLVVRTTREFRLPR